MDTITSLINGVKDTRIFHHDYVACTSDFYTQVCTVQYICAGTSFRAYFTYFNYSIFKFVFLVGRERERKILFYKDTYMYIYKYIYKENISKKDIKWMYSDIK